MTQTPTRIFALDPSTKGFGYAVFELPFRLVESNLVYVPGDKHAGALARFNELLVRFRPDAVVLEDTAAPGSRRRPRVRRLIDALQKLALAHDIPFHTIARRAILKRFSPEGEEVTKDQIAEQLAKHFPELAPHLPRRRKMWETEDARMALFDALALAVTYATA